jgi:flagellar protein FliO/FliZ
MKPAVAAAGLLTSANRAMYGTMHRTTYWAMAASLAAAALAPRIGHAADMNAINRAAQVASGVGAGTAVPTLGAGAVLQTLLALAVVIALVFGCAWLARRLGLQPGSQRGGLVRTIGGASLGGKERVAVVEIGDRWLVLGAAPGNVRLLCEMPAGSAAAGKGGSFGGSPASPDIDPATGHPTSGSGLQGSFGQRFRDALKSETARRLQRPGSGER